MDSDLFVSPVRDSVAHVNCEWRSDNVHSSGHSSRGELERDAHRRPDCFNEICICVSHGAANSRIRGSERSARGHCERYGAVDR